VTLIRFDSRVLPLCLAALCLTASARAADPAPASADTFVVDLPGLVVSGESAVAVDAGRTVVDAPAAAALDPVSVADLAVALPATRAAVNSRGDAHPMVRGAPERHVQTFLDGIPLNIPWDERVDLGTVPAMAIGGVEGRRGPASLLDGPGALAGSLRLLPPSPAGDRPASEAAVSLGTGGLAHLEGAHRRRAGAWNLLGAGAWTTRDHWPLPDGGGDRMGSDLDQASLLMRASREVAGAGRLSLLASAWTAEKGVPPELHEGDEARFWRYPVRERALAGGVLLLPLDEAGHWDLGVTVSADIFHQEIDPRGPDGWDTPLQTGDEYEKNWDRTGYGRLRLTRYLGDQATAAVQASARYTHHREILEVGGPTLDYAQWLASMAAEADWRPAAGWDLRAGAGWDHVATPESGDKPGSPADAAAAVNLRLCRDLGPDRGAYLAAGRRSRFPSLREAYSGALGRFVPNPDLAPERQDQVEVGLAAAGPRWTLDVAAFYGVLTDGIERVAVGGNQYQRVNRGEIRVPGLEAAATWRPAGDVDLTLHHTILDARVHEDDGERPAEDRPAYISRLAANYGNWRGPEAGLEARVTGPRWSADSTAPTGLTRLPAGVTWHLRLGWRWPRGRHDLAAHLRVDNVFDQRVDGQTGLPEPGRIVSAGLSWSR
jgi:iron complex outermembrane receptor protein